MKSIKCYQCCSRNLWRGREEGNSSSHMGDVQVGKASEARLTLIHIEQEQEYTRQMRKGRISTELNSSSVWGEGRVGSRTFYAEEAM